MNKCTFGSTFYDGTVVVELIKPIYHVISSDKYNDNIYEEGSIDKLVDHVVRTYVTSDDLRIINMNIQVIKTHVILLVTGDLVRVEKVGKIME